jgi:hypothetical protein
MEWIKKIVPTLGLLIGIIFVAIGGVMTLGSTLKYFFIEPDLSYVEEGCTYKFDQSAGKDMPLDQVSKEDCIERRTTQETTMQKNNFKRNLIDGFSFLVTGSIFWIIWNRKRDS